MKKDILYIGWFKKEKNRQIRRYCKMKRDIKIEKEIHIERRLAR